MGFDVQKFRSIPKGKFNAAYEPTYARVRPREHSTGQHISGAVLPVEQLAEVAQSQCHPSCFIRTRFRRLRKLLPACPFAWIWSLSGHKINGPKGVGAVA